MKVIIYSNCDQYTPLKRPDLKKLCGDEQMWKRGTDLLPRVNFYADSADIELLQCPQLVQLYNAYEEAGQLILEIEVGRQQIPDSQPWQPGATQPGAPVIEACGDRTNTLHMSDVEKSVLAKHLFTLDLNAMPEDEASIIADIFFMLNNREGDINKTAPAGSTIVEDAIANAGAPPTEERDEAVRGGVMGALGAKYGNK